MKIKTIIIMVTILLLTGCSPQYSLEIKNGKIKENLTISNALTESNKDQFMTIFANPEKREYYKKEVIGNTVNYSYNYNFYEFENSNFINSCYDAYKFYEVEDENYYVLQTSSQFKCYPLQISDFIIKQYESLNISIKIDGYKVIENNADYVDGNTYNWKIDKTNYNNKSILLKFEKPSKKDGKKEQSNFNPLLIIVVILVVLGIIGLILMYALNLNQKRNKL